MPRRRVPCARGRGQGRSGRVRLASTWLLEKRGEETSLTGGARLGRICEEGAPVCWLGTSRDGGRLARLAQRANTLLVSFLPSLARARALIVPFIALSMSRNPVVLITGASKCIVKRPASLELAC